MFVIRQQEAAVSKTFNRYFSVRHTGYLGIAHNGNLVNANHLKQHLERTWKYFQTTSDTEVLAHLIKEVKLPSVQRVKNAFHY